MLKYSTHNNYYYIWNILLILNISEYQKSFSKQIFRVWMNSGTGLLVDENNYLKKKLFGRKYE